MKQLIILLYINTNLSFSYSPNDNILYFLSVICNTSIIFESLIVTVGNCSGLPNVNVVVLICPDIASTCFLSR